MLFHPFPSLEKNATNNRRIYFCFKNWITSYRSGPLFVFLFLSGDYDPWRELPTACIKHLSYMNNNSTKLYLTLLLSLLFFSALPSAARIPTLVDILPSYTYLLFGALREFNIIALFLISIYRFSGFLRTRQSIFNTFLIRPRAPPAYFLKGISAKKVTC